MRSLKLSRKEPWSTMQLEERPWATPGKWNEIEAMRDATEAALESAGCHRREIDVVVFCGCDKCAPGPCTGMVQ